MARRKKHEEHENHERWLVSYADFITLLFAFFVVMYAVSSVNQGKYRVLSDSMVVAFKDPKKSIEPIQIGELAKMETSTSIEIMSKPTLIKAPVVNLNNQRSEPGKMPGAGFASSPENARDIQKIADEVAEAMQNLVDMGLVAITMTDLWVEVEIKDSVLFTSGSAVVRQEAVEALTSIAAILANFTNPIRIEGFTDNVPISRLYPSNWELSSARAASVVRMFEQFNIASTRLSAVGYGEHRPIASNDTAEGRAKNRRVALVVLADKEVEYLLDERLRHSASVQEVSAAPGGAGQAPPLTPAPVTKTPTPATVIPTPPVATPAPAREETPALTPAAPVVSDGQPPSPRPLPTISPSVRPLELAPPAAPPRVEPALPLELPAAGVSLRDDAGAKTARKTL
jgi:chemotaxis protein MotB